jgi:hypothetical protein
MQCHSVPVTLEVGHSLEAVIFLLIWRIFGFTSVLNFKEFYSVLYYFGTKVV